MPCAERFLAEVKAKDEGTKEEAVAAADDPGLMRHEGRWGANIARTHARCVPRSLRLPVAPAKLVSGLSRPRRSVRDTIPRELIVLYAGLH